LAKGGDGINIVKVHDACRRVPGGEWLFPVDAVQSVIYLVRHPFDVAVSFAPHMGLSLPDAVDLMSEGADSTQSPTALELPLPQKLNSWSANIISWLDNCPYNVTFARYEDLHTDPMTQFTRIARASGFDIKPERLAEVLNLASFDKMRDEEQASGFRERPRTSPTFFRAGKPRNWEGKLDESLREKIARDHAVVMARLGYLPDGSVVAMPGAAPA
jgi:aryl sulfotransferase